MQVKITDPTKLRLKEIYRYYRIKTSVKVANKIKDSIINKAMSLKKYPLKGQVEENLTELKQGHRYMISSHFKFIY